MIFGRGRIPKAKFNISNVELEQVKEFKYLGVVFTPQLTFSSHVQLITAKAKARIAYLFMRLPMYELSLELVVKLFHTYVLPIYLYCAPIWSSSLNSKNIIQQLNSVFTNYLKRYLGLPRYTQNAAVHFYTRTWPLYYAVKHLAMIATFKINFPANSLNGHKLSFAS